MPTIGRLGPRSGILRRCDTDPKVIHTSDTSRPLTSELKSAIFLPSRGDLSVFRAPLRAGAAHIVRLGPIPVRLIGHCRPPSIRSRTRLHSRAGKNVRYIRKLSMHLKSPVDRQCIDQGIRIRGLRGIEWVIFEVKAREKRGLRRGFCISRDGIFGMKSGWHEHRNASGGYGIRIRSQAFALSRRCAEFSVIRRRA